MLAQETNKDLNWDKVHQEVFQNLAFNHVQWIDKAIELIKAAKLLEPEVMQYWNELTRACNEKQKSIPSDYYKKPYFMLMSFAIENIFKAKYIFHNSYFCRQRFFEIMNSSIDEKKKLKSVFPNELKSHDLYKLSGSIGLDLTNEEEALLRRLSCHAVWGGRYPVPLDHKDISGTVKFSNGEMYHIHFFCENDVTTINKFIDSLPERLQLPISRSWPIE
ncbi:hypothetical protein [Solidesulfovibrio carbinolicus]|uniref:hypothetical protein n=1 Tax=Solidesulfovibrio carbinolicus TaxID=296842 RepID=UPI0010108062|nr:hypothetical protein [Solidesulfovibrio carbinolicus]